jgi:hypothetical protein
LVVPKSIPMTLAMVLYPSSSAPVPTPRKGDRLVDFLSGYRCDELDDKERGKTDLTAT